MSGARTLAVVIVAILVTAAVTALLAPSMTPVRTTTVTVALWPGDTTEPFTTTRAPKTVTWIPQVTVVPMTTITWTWTRTISQPPIWTSYRLWERPSIITTETYRLCEAIIDVTLHDPDRIIEYYITCSLYPETVTVTRSIEGPGHVQLTTTTTTVFVNRTETLTTTVTQR